MWFNVGVCCVSLISQIIKKKKKEKKTGDERFTHNKFELKYLNRKWERERKIKEVNVYKTFIFIENIFVSHTCDKVFFFGKITESLIQWFYLLIIKKMMEWWKKNHQHFIISAYDDAHAGIITFISALLLLRWNWNLDMKISEWFIAHHFLRFSIHKTFHIKRYLLLVFAILFTLSESCLPSP